jgi:hypothetical protein
VYILDEIDEIISILEDGEWHSVKDFGERRGIPISELWWIIRFLQKFGFLEMDEGTNKAKLTKSFLSLPVIDYENGSGALSFSN